MRKLFFLVIIALNSTFTFISASMPNSRAKSSPSGSSKPMSMNVPKSQPTHSRTVTPPPSYTPKPTPPKIITPPALCVPKSAPSQPITPSSSHVPKSAPSKAITSSSTNNGTKLLHDGNANSVIQKNVVSALPNVDQQQKQSTQKVAQAFKQAQASAQQNRLNKPNFQSNAVVIDDWNKPRQTSMEVIEPVRKVPEKEQEEDKVTSCEQILADLEECFDEDKVFWQLRNSYIHKNCEKDIHTIKRLPETVCYSVPYGVTLAYYKGWYFTRGNVANSAIGEAFLGAFPLVICSIAYTGENFFIGKIFSVELIKNYKQNQYETYDLKLLREATEKYAVDLQYALNRCLYRGAVGTVPINSIFYIAMCYGYDDDPDAKVITIVDKEKKQHIFVISNNSIFNSVIQISDGSSEVNALISYRYLVPQSTILALNMTRQY